MINYWLQATTLQTLTKLILSKSSKAIHHLVIILNMKQYLRPQIRLIYSKRKMKSKKVVLMKNEKNNFFFNKISTVF
ncbi:MAG: hypothetical protein ACI9XO_003806 [Paraglaciecola sp.]